MIKVELSFDRTSEPLVFNNVMNTYQKGDLFCIYYYDGEKSVYDRFPIDHIFRVREYED